MSKLKWFKHYNTAHEGQLFCDLIITGQHEAALLAYIIMELISRFEDETRRGYASVPIDRLARAMNMKPSKIDRLLAVISVVSRSDLVCETDEEQPRNRSFLMRNWLKYQETRGGKRSAKNEQNTGRSKKGEGKKGEERSKNSLLSDDKVTEAYDGSVEDRFSPEDLASLWNEIKPEGLSAVIQPLSEGRKEKARRILKKYPEREFWQDVIGLIKTSKFLMGNVPVSGNRSAPWLCSFDWIIKGDNAIKIIEGNYK